MGAEHSAELTERTERALSEIVQYFSDPPLTSRARGIARMMWLDGYKHGMDAAKALAEDAITKALS